MISLSFKTLLTNNPVKLPLQLRLFIYNNSLKKGGEFVSISIIMQPTLHISLAKEWPSLPYNKTSGAAQWIDLK